MRKDTAIFLIVVVAFCAAFVASYIAYFKGYDAGAGDSRATFVKGWLADKSAAPVLIQATPMQSGPTYDLTPNLGLYIPHIGEDQKIWAAQFQENFRKLDEACGNKGKKK